MATPRMIKTPPINVAHSITILGILEKPFWNTRYGSQLQSSNNFEIFIGHHRAAALYVLGYRDIKVVLLRDDHGNSMTIENHFKFL